MKSVWTVFKESVSEWVKKWWFILSLFTVPILGLLTSSVGFTLARLENSERLKETINYGWFTHAYNSHFPYCLLYTSDAADDLLCVDLGGRRIIKKKKKK